MIKKSPSEIRDLAYDMAKFVLQNPSCPPFLRDLKDQTKKAITNDTPDCPGREFMRNAAQRMNDFDFTALVMEIGMADQFGQPVMPILERYNNFKSRTHDLFPEPEAGKDPHAPHAKMNRRRFMMKALSATAAAATVGAIGAREFVPELSDEQKRDLLMVAAAGAGSAMAGVAESLMNLPLYSAHDVVKIVDHALLTRQQGVAIA